MAQPITSDQVLFLDTWTRSATWLPGTSVVARQAGCIPKFRRRKRLPLQTAMLADFMALAMESGAVGFSR
jgi:hypothetical protein